MSFLFFKTSQPAAPTRLSSLRVTQSILNTSLPIVFGTARIAPKMVWYGNFQSVLGQQSTGGGGGGSFGGGGGGSLSYYDYFASVLQALCIGPIQGVSNLWDSKGRFTYATVTETYTITAPYTYTVTNAPAFNLDMGATYPVTYNFTSNDYVSGPSTNPTYNNTTFSGITPTNFTYTSGVPGPGQYTYNASTGVYTFNAADTGTVASISYSYGTQYSVLQEIDSIPATSPYQITVSDAAEYYSDMGVIYFETTSPPSGTAFTAVGSTPTAAGTYQYLGLGVYQFAAADAAQTIRITYQTYVANTDTLAPTIENFEVFSGFPQQTPWDFLTTNYPGNGLGYTNMATVGWPQMFLGSQAEVPNYNYEVVGLELYGGGIPDASPADCIEQLLTNPTYGIGTYGGLGAFQYRWIGDWTQARNFWAANSFFISPVIDQQTSLATEIGNYLTAGLTWMFWSEGLLKLVPLGDTTAVGNGVTFTPNLTPIVDLDDDDFIPQGKNTDPVKITRAPWQDAFNYITVEYEDRLGQYYNGTVVEQDESAIRRYGFRPEQSQSWHFIKTQTAATVAANLRMKRSVTIRNQYQFKIGYIYSFLEPGDLVTISVANITYLNYWPVRIVKVEDDPNGELTLTCEDFPYGTANPTLYTKAEFDPFYPVSGQADPGDTAVLVWEDPYGALSQQKGNLLFIAASGLQQNWGGCEVHASFDNQTYTLMTTLDHPSYLGTFATPMPPGPGWIAHFHYSNISNIYFLWDNNGNVQYASTPGQAGATYPAFSNVRGGTTVDNTITWTCCGPIVPWQASTAFAKYTAIYDLLGSVEIVTTAGTTGSSQPIWVVSTVLSTLSDNTVTWTNLTNYTASGANSPTIIMNAANMNLPTVSNAAAAQGVALCVGFSSTGVPTYFSYQTATLTAANSYTLTGITQHLRNSIPQLIPGLSGSPPTGGSPFVYIGQSPTGALSDQSVFTWQYDSSYYGKTIYLKFLSFNTVGNRKQSLAAATAYPFVIQGSGPGAIDLVSGISRVGDGSVPNAWVGSMNWTEATTSITITWSLQVARSTPPNPTQPLTFLDYDTYTGTATITGLTSGHEYWFFPFVDDYYTDALQAGGNGQGSGEILFVGGTDFPGNTGTPAIAYDNAVSTLAERAAAVQYAARNDHKAIFSNGFSVTTTSGGGTSGTAGGTGYGTGGMKPLIF